MTAKEWLQRGWNLNKEIDELIAAKDEALTSACGTTAHTGAEKVQESAKNSSEIKFTNYAEYSMEIDRMVDRLVGIKHEILKVVSTLDNSTYRTLLIARYVNFKTWEQIAVGMSYNYRWVLRLHKKALVAMKQAIESHMDSVI